eukprot:CAMPEP_0184497340 /NCGR_PEP_ID=MMETSP0113_2-20130426/36232_1 /TAXON_ID=91329 /ORGANISM="Norrisiella sphaerica, Strain BC52" /LENGTH=516 /DNA_ID=CAMNT_0026884395 /DNA_START=24 /DNA_END=1571 /DNA_ORIENTATION=-
MSLPPLPSKLLGGLTLAVPLMFILSTTTRAFPQPPLGRTLAKGVKSACGPIYPGVSMSRRRGTQPLGNKRAKFSGSSRGWHMDTRLWAPTTTQPTSRRGLNLGLRSFSSAAEAPVTENLSASAKNAYDVLMERGFIKESTQGVKELLGKERVKFYVGFDPTADSLHVGSLVPIMAMAQLQRNGHEPIALLGGGTGMIGDPSGKEEARQMMTLETIEKNKEGIRKQLERFIDLGEGKGMMVDNAEWLLGLNYIDFLRDFGSLFSVNVMLTKASVKTRLERGMSFLEFNYQLLQAYDYLELYRRHKCTLQIGGDDQWGNIVGGIDLVRRLEQKEVGAITFPLLTTASGAKMGKTASGAVWLSPDKYSPYDYYQYWVNVDDRDVERFLKLFTFLPMERIEELGNLKGADIRKAKAVLAYEATGILHGKEEAEKAKKGAEAAFGGAGDVSAIPKFETEFPTQIVPLLVATGLCSSKADARRSIAGGGIRINGEKVTDPDLELETSMLDDDNALILQKGKK